MTFSEFYASYPKKVARKDAEKAWAKLSPTERAQALEALPTHVRYWELKGVEKHYIPHPATWLNGARFEDELDLAEHVPKTAVAWWATDEGVMKKGAELGIRARGGESMQEYKVRLIDAVRRGLHAA